MGKGQYRDKDSISGKWSNINSRCTLFQSVYQRQRNGWRSGERSGASDEDILQSSLTEFQAANGHFQYMKCWQLLRKCSKWHNVPTNVGTSSGRSANRRPSKRSKTTSSADPETPTSDARNIDLNEANPYFEGEEGANEPVEEQPRPPGRRSGGRSTRPESTSTGSDLTQAFSEMNQRLQDIHSLGSRRLEENQKVVAIMEKMQWKEDFAFYSSSIDHLSGKALEMARKRKADIEKEYDI